MVRFLDINAFNDHLDLLVKGAAERLIVCNPLLKFTRRVRRLFGRRHVQNIGMQFLCARCKLTPEDVSWVQSQPWLNITEIPHLHAKCYLSEEMAILGSMSLYQYRRSNGGEMGTLILRREDPQLFGEVQGEVERLLATAQAGRRIVHAGAVLEMALPEPSKPASDAPGLPDWQIADRLGIKLNDLYDFLAANGLLTREQNRWVLTRKGKAAGGEAAFSKRYGPYFSWPSGLDLLSLVAKRPTAALRLW